MLLTCKTTVKLNNNSENIIGHMCYAAYKLWNICNYERIHHKELDLPVNYPDWYYQKKAHKNDLWYKQLPSQTAQEVCKLLDKSWKSFYTLEKTHGIENPKPPRFKHDPVAITYMQNGIAHSSGEEIVRLSLPKQLKLYMADCYDIHDNYLFLKNRIFKDINVIKQIKIYPPAKGECSILIIYETKDTELLADNGKYLSIDLGIHNFFTCYASDTGETFIIGRKYLSICHYYNKEIARVQSQWSSVQSGKGVKYPKTSKHIGRLHQKKNNAIRDYLHKMTRYLVNYCLEKDIHTIVIGDITNIRNGKNFGNITNQKLHALPYKKVYSLLEYKLRQAGVRLVMQNEAYSSQTSPLKPAVSKDNAEAQNRKRRGLYVDGNNQWNADCVGAFNIMRLFLTNADSKVVLADMKEPNVIKVAV